MSGTGSGPSGGPLPTIGTAQLSRSSSPSRSCAIPPAATSFLTTDTEVWAYLSVPNALANDVLRVDWVNPNGVVAFSDPFQPLPSPGPYCFNDHLTTAADPRPVVAGAWNVRFYWNGALLTTLPVPISAPGGGGAVSLNLQTALQQLNLAPGVYGASALAPVGLTVIANPAGTPGASGSGSLVVQAVGPNEVHPPGTTTEAFFNGPGIAFNVVNCTTLAWTGSGSLSSFTITRPGMRNNASIPAWAMYAYSAIGTQLSTSGEGSLTTGGFLQPANSASFTVSSTNPIAEVVFCSHNGSSTYNALPLSGSNGAPSGGGSWA